MGMAVPPPSLQPTYADSFQSGYFTLMRRILEGPALINAPRGNQSAEILCVDLVLTNPRNRLVTLPARRANLAFQFAELLWYLAGSDDVAMLSHYAPGVRKYSADGKTLAGTSYGPRIFAWRPWAAAPAGESAIGPAGINQWSAVKALLRRDPDTKRAVISIFSPTELLQPDNPDVACTLAMQFIRRDGLLHCVTHMRANDAYRGIVSDVFSFTMLHELMAVELDLAMGAYYHRVSSLHLYEPDLPRATASLDAWVKSGGPVPPAMDRLPAVPLVSWLPTVLAAEADMRLSGSGWSAGEILALGVPDQWAHVVAVLAGFNNWRAGKPPDPLVTKLQPPLWQAMMDVRFPQDPPRHVR